MIPRLNAVMRTAVAALALIPGSSQAAPRPGSSQAAPPASSAICYEVADHLWSDIAPGEASGDLSLVAALGKAGFVVRSEFGDAAIAGDDGSLRQVLADRFKAPADLLAKIDETAGREVIRIGRSDVWVLDTVGGTASCHTLTGFVLPQNGSAREMAVPIAGSDGDMCGAMVFGVSVGATGALWVQTDGAFTTDFSRSNIAIAPLGGDSLRPPCSLTVRYALDFVATEAFCDGVDCAPLMKAGEVIARRRDAGDDATVLGATALAVDKRQAEYKRMSDLAAAEHAPYSLPSFGHDGSSAYTQFGESVTFPLFVGSLYLARLGHGRLGWRDSPDYLLALYTMRDSHLVPVAGIHLEARRRTITAVNVH